MKKTTKYTAHGVMVGHTWSGSMGSYPFSDYEADTKEGIIELITKAVETKKLKGAGNFESLSGAAIQIKEHSKIEFEGKPYTNDDFLPIEYVGKLTDEEKDWIGTDLSGMY